MEERFQHDLLKRNKRAAGWAHSEVYFSAAVCIFRIYAGASMMPRDQNPARALLLFFGGKCDTNTVENISCWTHNLRGPSIKR